MNKLVLEGTYTALITPFTNNFSIDFNALEMLVEKQIEAGVEGLVILGSTAEAQTLTIEEKTNVMLKVQEKVNGRIPIIVGTGSNDTSATVKFTQIAKEHQFDGVLLVVPYYNKPSTEGLYNHYKTISDAVDIPQILYNVPSRTGINMHPSTVWRLATDCKNIIGIKEASGDLEQMMQIIYGITRNDFAVMSGEDSLAIPSTLMGANGVISVLSNYAPRNFGNGIRLALKGNLTEAVKVHYSLLNFMKLNFIETNPVAVKAIMKQLSIIAEHTVRLPLTPITKENGKILAEAFEKWEDI